MSAAREPKPGECWRSVARYGTTTLKHYHRIVREVHNGYVTSQTRGMERPPRLTVSLTVWSMVYERCPEHPTEGA